MTVTRITLALALAIPVLGQDQPALPPLPSYFAIAPQAQLKAAYNTYELYGEADFAMPNEDPHFIRGRHWGGVLVVSGVPDGTDAEDVWIRQVKPPLVNAGWTFLSDQRGHGKIARFQKDGHDTWLKFWAGGVDDMEFDVVEAGPCPIRLKLPKPADQPETIDANSGDFPFLPPVPGSTLNHSDHDDQPMIVTIVFDKDHSEDQVAGTGSITKFYKAPPFQSPVLFETIYSNAFRQAGWKVTRESHGADAAVTAHYAAGNRNLWAYVHGGGGDYTIQVADEANLAAQLDRDCHVAVYGIQFDFDKATIRADSEPVLQNVLAILNARTDLKLEIQGHTDNVGSEEYNQKLSEARAASVVAWLSGKGVAPGRLTAHGYGMTQPIADNGSDEGRARNRRVELKKVGCTAQ